jgi:hypothetical protein
MTSKSDNFYSVVVVRILSGDAKVMELIEEDTTWWNMSMVKEIVNEDEAERICGMIISLKKKKKKKKKDQLFWIDTSKE